MPPFIYIIAAVAAISFGTGIGVTRQFYKGEIISMEVAIEKANDQSAAVLAAAKERSEKAQAEAVSINNELEKANESSIQTINYYHSKLADARLRDPGKTSCTNSVPAGNNSKKPIGSSANDGFLSDEATKFLREESYRADQVTIYAQECYKFVAEHNCGIAK